MTSSKLVLSAVLSGMITAGAAHAADDMEAASPSKVKCYGIAKAGQNACANATGSHGCQGMAKVDNDPNEFVQVSQEECDKAGGKTAAPEVKKLD